MNNVALRIQGLPRLDQVLVLLHLAQVRSETGLASAKDVGELYLDLAISPPVRPGNILLSLEKSGLTAKARGHGQWNLTPLGKQRLTELDLEGDLPRVLAGIQEIGFSPFGGVGHPVVPPEMAPPELAHAVRDFLREHPFDANIFAMTRFPATDHEKPDPVSGALEVARSAAAMHGFEMHLASDRAIVDDLWMNVSAHMWASRYGIALFEDLRSRGLNHNMTIEVGAMLMSGRRCALLKDPSIGGMPTDLVGKIYKPVELADDQSVAETIHAWLRDDLGSSSCPKCPERN